MANNSTPAPAPAGNPVVPDAAIEVDPTVRPFVRMQVFGFLTLQRYVG